MVPFKGIPATDVLVPLDLIYLGEDCRVIETVEFYPTFRCLAFESAGDKRTGASPPFDFCTY